MSCCIPVLSILLRIERESCCTHTTQRVTWRKSDKLLMIKPKNAGGCLALWLNIFWEHVSNMLTIGCMVPSDFWLHLLQLELSMSFILHVSEHDYIFPYSLECLITFWLKQTDFKIRSCLRHLLFEKVASCWYRFRCDSSTYDCLPFSGFWM
jgi:hypothetical protein